MATSRLCSFGIDSSSLAYSPPLSFSDTLFFSSRVSNPNEEVCFTGRKRLRLPCMSNTIANPATKDRETGSGQDGRHSQTAKDGRRSLTGRNGRGQGRVRDEQRTKSRRDNLSRDSKQPLILLPEPIGRREAICKPSIDDHLLTQKFLRGPLLKLKSLPVLSSCLPNAPFNAEDHEWMDENLGRIREVLSITPATNAAEKLGENSPLFHLDSLLYLAFQHDESSRSMRSQHVKTAHSRLWFLGEHVLELALAEYLLTRYPREMPACIRERVLGLINKRVLPHWFRKASLDRFMFPDYGMDSERSNERLQVIRGVFWALIGAVYLSMGMGEIYRILFEVFGFDPDAKSCQPKERFGREDIDRVYPLFDAKPMSWRDLATKTEDDALFAKPLLYWACVPLGMERFRGNLWEIDSLPYVLQILGYPLPSPGEDSSVTIARNAALELGLQLCFLHPSKFKTDHPRFCNERLEYLGSKIQDVVMAEKLLMRNLIARGLWLKERHRQITYNSAIGRYFREKKLQNFMIIADSRVELFQKSKRVRNFATTGVAMALHGLGYAVYGKSEVRRLMFDLFDIERLQAHID